MGDKSFSTFKTDLKLHLGRGSSDTTLDDHTGSWINSAYITLTTMNRFWGLRRDFYFPELFDISTTSCVDGTAYVSAPARCLYVNEVWDTTNDVRLDKISWGDYIEKAGRADTDSEGAPKFWVTRGATDSSGAYRKIWVYPTPSGGQGIQIFYRRIPAVLTADTDTTEIGIEWDEPLLDLAVIQSHIRLNEFDRADYKKQGWIDTITNLIGIYDKEDLAKRDVRSPKLDYVQREY